MPKGFGQYCPLALAAELLCERWTLLIVSRLVDGCRRFNEIHRGVPKISATLLSQRLAALERAGLVERRPLREGRGHEYLLTEAGRELDPIIMQLAVWGQKWGRDMVSEDLDPAFLAWSMHTRLATEAMPAGRTVIGFEFAGSPVALNRFWLVHEGGRVDMCLKHPGFDEDLRVLAEIRRFVEAWRGFRDLRAEIRAGRIRLEGPEAHCRAFPDWLRLSALAAFPRERAGAERALAAEEGVAAE
ncbi:helix-turn-helix domain-containing protein [Paralimibaculum aggregatum]|uniref:Helix-turn-helix domain-containing protein n=1 Tax=Paralimibaculum aggregatum TaxID=3036245 RepID=A0ABQ6LC99_9RHOB|nr:helix-turn-helix domain-containing protein [Limibaculum sp. NKW23]GMG81003.1 helix-turn-helix domain-containing protein [Limibaculum sp. NKW23]